jgi:hypothetical protein
LSFIKDYGKDYSTHPRVLVKSANSTAAGAYQILGWVYDQLNGYVIDKKTHKKTGEYQEKRDYVKKHNLPDFSALSQDRLCLILLKYYRKGSIDALINDNINKALDITSFEWASLPHNDKNYIKTGTQWRYPGQHGQTLEEARANYKMFLKEELEGKTKYLQIKKGFLKEFGYDCCESKESANCSCGKTHIDLRDKIKWQTQFDSKWGDKIAQNSACKKTCDDILINIGLSATSLSRLFQTSIENEDHTKLIINTDVSKEGVKYLDSELDKDHPVQVGVDHDLNYKINNNSDHSTDHFIVIIGRGCENDKPYYLFYDVGTSYENKGASDENRLYLDTSDYSLKGKTVYNGNFYTVTQIRKN